MKGLRIILLGTVAAIVYGVVHDQVTSRVCLEYFTVFHPPVFPTKNPTLLGLGWGVIATWWVGLPLGIVLAVASRAGPRVPKLTARELVRPLAVTLGIVAMLAALSGFWGWWQATRGALNPPVWVAEKIPLSEHARFVAAWWSHGMSYLAGCLGGLALSVATLRRRKRQE